MNKKERIYLEEIYRDCIKLEKKKDLTEHGRGQGDLCIDLLNRKRSPFKSYNGK